MCVDYSNLNDAYLKDTFPLLRINQRVDETAGHQFLSFLNAYFVYNKIPMNPVDSENMAFITLTRMYCYNVMPFGLENAGATHERMIDES